MTTGEVRAVIGETVKLGADEELWEKKLSSEMAELIKRRYDVDATRVVSYQAGDNTAIQIFDYKENKQRVEFGPGLIQLQANEEIKMMAISGGVPKRENAEKVICLPLGQNMFEDEIIVVTQDHASLIMKLSYSAHFRIDDEIIKNPNILFNVSDFIGITCKTVASKIRGIVSGIPYNEFHHNYSRIVKEAVFGQKTECFFPENHFVLTQCDVKQLEPNDMSIRDKLKKNTSQSIDLKTKASELEYKMKSKILEEESEGQLKLKRFEDETKAAEQQVKLDELTVKSEAIKQAGVEKAKAQANAEALKIKGESELNQSESIASSFQIETKSLVLSMEQQNKKVEDQTKESDQMQIDKERKMSQIELSRFTAMIETVGRDTIIAMSKSGPENKAKLLQSLGLQGYLVTDGKTPINLFQTADGLVSHK